MIKSQIKKLLIFSKITFIQIIKDQIKEKLTA